MNITLRRTCAASVVLGGIGLILWLGFGLPRDGDDLGLWALRVGLGLAGLGAIHGGVRLMFPDRSGESDAANMV
ncbi:hypothetical protein GCM10010329_33650 [Streptomyces spiroverticillatus]|uniref:Uncharacterized protein n=1 Tax=Streptomyces finlayi TaxID=67296 RepID=A0A918WWU3_9ACTN|nr:hypothetical protein [Streptomyces finlayi]GHA08161.1 hypothetical protein GCM10010329_33650 [Streptomyces spiroverticillatus]GHC91227.1 hypothetical protein GCM10010334_26060 [Streptomyces finlayi]